jgi:hypothetical protein
VRLVNFSHCATPHKHFLGLHSDVCQAGRHRRQGIQHQQATQLLLLPNVLWDISMGWVVKRGRCCVGIDAHSWKHQLVCYLHTLVMCGQQLSTAVNVSEMAATSVFTSLYWVQCSLGTRECSSQDVCWHQLMLDSIFCWCFMYSTPCTEHALHWDDRIFTSATLCRPPQGLGLKWYHSSAMNLK